MVSLRLLPVLLLCCAPAFAGAAAPGVVELFAQEPAMSTAAVSPDGKHIGALQRFEKDGKQFLLIYEVANLSKKPVTLAAEPMDIVAFSWVSNERLVVRLRQDVGMLQEMGVDTRQAFRLATIDRTGDSDWLEIPRRRADRRSRVNRVLEQVSNASVFSLLPRDERHILIEYDDDKNGVSDIFKVNVKTGSAKRIVRNSKVTVVYLDEDEEPRLAIDNDVAKTAIIYLARLKGGKEWIEIGRTEPSIDSVSQSFGAFFQVGSPESNEFYVQSNHETDTAGIYIYDLEKRSFGELQFQHPSYDATGIRSLPDLSSSHGRRLLGFGYSGKSAGSVYLTDPKEKALYESLESYFAEQGDLNIQVISRSRDEHTMVVRVEGPRMPATFYLLNKGRMDLLGHSMPGLKPEMLSDVEWTSYTARDGTRIPALVTIPQGEGPFPVIVHPHGGPVARDFWGFDLWAQFLAHHGYLVIQPQFRISTGFGRKHLEAGFARWGLEMQDDLEDAITYLNGRGGLADTKRVAIFGWSYGGYAAFVGSQRDPNPFSCAIAGAGVGDLPYFRAWLADFGDFTEATYRKTIAGISPLEHVDSVDIPILVVHGDLDERVPVAESRKFVRQLEKYNKQHKYLELKGANHFFGTIYYRHWMQMFPAMLDWLDDTCGMKST